MVGTRILNLRFQEFIDGLINKGYCNECISIDRRVGGENQEKGNEKGDLFSEIADSVEKIHEFLGEDFDVFGQHAGLYIVP